MDGDQVHKHEDRRRDLKYRKSRRGGKAAAAQPIPQDSSQAPSNDCDDSQDDGRSFSKRQLVSNWSRYDAPSEAKTVSRAADFTHLMKAPITEGGHFKFKSERAWEQPSERNEIFSLDLKQLGLSLSCVPFYEQVNVSRELFTEEEMSKMNNEAKVNGKKYSSYLKSKSAGDVTSKCDVPPESSGFLEKLSELIVSESRMKDVSFVEDDDEDLDFLLTLKERVADEQVVEEKAVEVTGDVAVTPAPTTPEASPESDKKDDLEDWLDSILDE